MNDARYNVQILSVSHSLFFKNREVRTPVEFSNITDQELRLLKLEIKKYDLKYTIKLEQEEIESFIIEEDKEIIIEYLNIEECKNKSILDQLINDEK